MIRRSFGILMVMALALTGAAAAQQSSAPATKLSAAQIADRNVAARGGLQAWRSVQTLSFAGKIGAGGNRRSTLGVPPPIDAKGASMGLPAPRRTDEVQLPFVMEFARPRKQRFELKFNGQTAIQVYDGANGWKLRPFLNRREVESFTTDEMKIASMQEDLDGPLVDYASKGTQVELAGTEKVEGRETYKLKLTMKSGRAIHIWIDAQTFLEAKIEGQPRKLDGTEHPVEVYYRDFRTVNGLQIPFVLETRVLRVAQTVLGLRDVPVPPERIIVEKVEVNPKLDSTTFAKPAV